MNWQRFFYCQSAYNSIDILTIIVIIYSFIDHGHIVQNKHLTVQKYLYSKYTQIHFLTARWDNLHSKHKTFENTSHIVARYEEKTIS